MKLSINKAKTAAVITMVLLMASVTLIAMPVKAQLGSGGGTPGASLWGPLPAGVTPDVTVITYAFLSVTSNPIGVGQTALFNIWTTPSAAASVYASGYKVTMTKPDNTTVTVGPMNSYYADRTTWFEYIFDQAGTWKVKLDYPGDYYPPGNYTTTSGYSGGTYQGYTTSVAYFNLSRWYMPCSSPVTEVVVQQELVPTWPPSPLPTHEYWTRPVFVQNREWWVLLGNYPWSGSGEGWPNWPADTNYFKSNYRYQPLVTAPNSAHIVWKRQDAISGLIGGAAGIDSLTSSGSAPGLIYAGRCYQTRTINMDNGSWISCACCYDLRTGEQYYAVPTAGYNPGVTPTLISYVEPVTGEVLGSEGLTATAISLIAFSGTFMYKINPLTGLISTNVTTLGSGTFIDPYMINIQTNNTATGPRWINWTTAGTSTNFTSRIMDNRTYNSTSIGTNVDWQAGVFGSLSSITLSGASAAPIGCRILGYSLKTGQLICNFTDTYVPYQTGTVCVDHGKIACLMQNGYAVAYDLQQGKRAWVSEQTFDVGGYPWGTWGSYGSASYGGNYLQFLYDGVYAFNWDTGNISWVYRQASVPNEDPYGGWTPFFMFGMTALIADGKIFVANGEHGIESPRQPIPRGWGLQCINATTGKGIWNITDPMNPGAMADGYLTAGAQDGYMYVFGRGKSATTISAPVTTVAKGTPVLIQGTVLDQSPAQPGAACVSDDSQATYMEYLHMQFPIDGIFHNVHILGVPVMLIAVDSNGAVINIGTVTSDVSGCFKTAWTPPAEGVYTVSATFAGSESYGSSWAEAAVSIGPAPATPTPTPTEQPQVAPDNSPLIYATVAIIAAIAIVGILILLALRKRP